MATTIISPHGTPERHSIKNFPLPVLVYRACLPLRPTTSTIVSFLEPNNWIEDPQYVNNPNQPPLTHKCLAVSKGHSRLLLTKGDPDMNTAEVPMGFAMVDLYERDLIVIPSGVVHRSVEEIATFDHVVLYPKRNVLDLLELAVANGQGGNASRMAGVRIEPLPERDPIFGLGGPLVGIWREAEHEFTRII